MPCLHGYYAATAIFARQRFSKAFHHDSSTWAESQRLGVAEIETVLGDMWSSYFAASTGWILKTLTAVKFYKEINMNSVKVCSVSQAFSNAYGESKPQGNFRTVATADVITVKRIWRVSYSLEMELTLCPYHTRCNSILKSILSISVLPICSINIIVTSHKKSYSKPGNTLKLMTVIKQAMKWNETSGVLSKIKQQNGYISKISHAHHWSLTTCVQWPQWSQLASKCQM